MSSNSSVAGTLYIVGYSHLDTQWRWDYTHTITECIKNTLQDNLALMDKYPTYRFNFTGAIRYVMMREYYPELYERMRERIREGRWCVSGSSVDEGDVNVPSPESILRQILYGNRWFQRELGATSEDYMLPDCFGFPASFPSVLAHAGLKGFSTQKLQMGCGVTIPFNIGVWEGPDGHGIVCQLDPGFYGAGIEERIDLLPKWKERIEANGEHFGLFADYRYYGVGDLGGAPKEEDVQRLVNSLDQPDAPLRVVVAASDQMFKEVTPAQMARMPRYRGDLLLREHSTGCLTSQAYMKRWNRKNECLADAAERAAVLANWLGALPYPFARLEAAWFRVLGSQFHDILPGTSVPRAYEFSWNDEVLGMNQFAGILQGSLGAVAQALDTTAQGRALLIHNPLAIERLDTVEATLALPEATAWRVFRHDGVEVPSQSTRAADGAWKLIFVAQVPSLSLTTYDVRPATTPCSMTTDLRISGRILENAAYRVTVDVRGDIVSIIDKRNSNREILSAPAQLQLCYEKPREWPAWNMDWADRQQPPLQVLDGPARIRIVEEGPARVALEVRREARGSVFVQQIRLAAGSGCVEVYNQIEWQTRECSLRASFPLTVSNPEATYHMGLGVTRRGNNTPDKYEVPSQEWFDLTDASGDYGVAILEDCKFGSDKPADNTLRLTLLYTPGVRGNFREQGTQDWGRHEILYAIHGHAGDWRQGGTVWRARRLNQPLQAFQVPSHSGPLGRRFSLASLNTTQVDIRAIKKSEDGHAIVVRVQELEGRSPTNVMLSFAAPVMAAMETDGQEREIGPAVVRDGNLVFNLTPFAPRTFAVLLGAPPVRIPAPESQAIPLPFDITVTSGNTNRAAGDMAGGWSYPDELLPATVDVDGVEFKLGARSAGARNAMICRGQSLALPTGDFNRIYVLAAATEDTVGEFAAGGQIIRADVPAWTGFIGQYDNREWSHTFPPIEFSGPRGLDRIAPGYIKRTPVAWFATHCHSAERDEAYRFCYLFQLSLPLPAGATELRLPDNDKIRVMAVSVARTACASAEPAQPLYDDFTGRQPMVLKHRDLPLPYARVPRAAPPGAKGDPAKVDWTKAAEMSVSHSIDGYLVEKRPAALRLVHDGQFLYIRMDEAGDHANAKDDGFSGDRWEIFFGTKRDKPYRQIGVFPGGVAYWAVGEDPDIAEWTRSVTVQTVTRDANTWQWHLSIPLDRLAAGGVKPGSVVYMNFLRGTLDEVEGLAWSPLYGTNFHQPLRMGEVTLED